MFPEELPTLNMNGTIPLTGVQDQTMKKESWAPAVVSFASCLQARYNHTSRALDVIPSPTRMGPVLRLGARITPCLWCFCQVFCHNEENNLLVSAVLFSSNSWSWLQSMSVWVIGFVNYLTRIFAYVFNQLAFFSFLIESNGYRFKGWASISFMNTLSWLLTFLINRL